MNRSFSTKEAVNFLRFKKATPRLKDNEVGIVSLVDLGGLVCRNDDAYVR